MAAAKELKAAEKQDTRIVHGWKLCWKPRANSTQPGDFPSTIQAGRARRQLQTPPAQLQRDASDKAEDKAVAQATVARVRAIWRRRRGGGSRGLGGEGYVMPVVSRTSNVGVNAGMNLVPAAKVASLNISEVSLPAPTCLLSQPRLWFAASVPPADTAA